MHTNSIEGVAPRYGRRRRLSDEAVEEVLEDIRRDAGGVALHAITRAVGAEGRQYLEREGWRALAPAESEKCRAMPPPPGRKPNLTRLAW